jgi:hypothetical protein
VCILQTSEQEIHPKKLRRDAPEIENIYWYSKVTLVTKDN